MRARCDVMANRSDREQGQPKACPRRHSLMNRMGPCSRTPSGPAVSTDCINRPDRRLHPTNATASIYLLQRGSHPQRTWCSGRDMSAIRTTADVICSGRVFRLLTLSGHANGEDAALVGRQNAGPGLKDASALTPTRVHARMASISETIASVAMTRLNEKPHVSSKPRNSEVVRSRAWPNIAIIWVSTR